MEWGGTPAPKSKGVPRQAEVAQGVPGRLRPQIFFTFQHYKGGRSSAKRTGRLYPRRNPWYSLSEAESTSGHMVLSGVPRKKSPVTPPGIDPGTVRLVAQCLNHYATPGPKYYGSILLNSSGRTTVSDKSFKEKSKPIFMLNKFFQKIVPFRDMWKKKYARDGQTIK